MPGARYSARYSAVTAPLKFRVGSSAGFPLYSACEIAWGTDGDSPVRCLCGSRSADLPLLRGTIVNRTYGIHKNLHI